MWTADEARQEARVQIGRVARGDDPAEEREFDRNAMTVRQLCEYYVRDLDAGLILGKSAEADVGEVSDAIERIGFRSFPGWVRASPSSCMARKSDDKSAVGFQ